MSVFKEFYHGANVILKASRQVFPDSADYGVPVKKGDKYWNLSKQIADQYFSIECDKREEAKYGTGSSVNMYITTFNEWDGSMDEEVWLMSYTTARNNKDMDGILSIQCTKRCRNKASKYSDY